MNQTSFQNPTPQNFAPAMRDCFADQKYENKDSEFDAYAAQYEEALDKGLSISGEGPEYFASHRIRWTANVVSGLTEIEQVLDFGCGVGIASPMIQDQIKPKHITGFDPSAAAIERAIRDFGDDSISFICHSAKIPDGKFDLAYCNGVFHHIMPEDRPGAFQTVYRSLKPGGRFAFWENNPWNPGTRYVMSKIPFDRDAVVIYPAEAKTLLTDAGFKVNRLDTLFLFPRSLKWLRPLERLVSSLPIGAQYLVLAEKPY